AAAPNAIAIATLIARAEIHPEATARGGPRRSGPSAPRAASKTSFAKLVPIWIANAPPSAQSMGAHAIPPSAYAHAVPTATGATDVVSVRGRAAAILARAAPGLTGTA